MSGVFRLKYNPEQRHKHSSCAFAPLSTHPINLSYFLKMAFLLRNFFSIGKMTFQKGFMSGEITAKGNFKTLRMLDQVFRFRYSK